MISKFFGYGDVFEKFIVKKHLTIIEDCSVSGGCGMWRVGVISLQKKRALTVC
jgi:hypothetical protein